VTFLPFIQVQKKLLSIKKELDNPPSDGKKVSAPHATDTDFFW
jgi:hypothetical protein